MTYRPHPSALPLELGLYLAGWPTDPPKGGGSMALDADLGLWNFSQVPTWLQYLSTLIKPKKMV